MAQRQVTNLVPDEYGENDEAQDLPMELTYDQLNADTINDNEFNALFEHQVPFMTNESRNRMLFSHLAQQSYSMNRDSLFDSLEAASLLLHDLITENDQRAIYFPNMEDSLHVLQLKLRLDGKEEMDLDKSTMAQLFKRQATSAAEHLGNLKTRVQDTSSKVFITGDLNSGKSTLCNAFLRKKILPEDQLPCTNVFCEILEARENSNLEQVHAIPISLADNVRDASILYDITDKCTYEEFPLEKLEDLVYANDSYSLLKVYIKDNKRPIDYSLLRNGTADISLIDSPGLNMDSVKTTEVMSRQEEIDLVVFVVNAENQLTLSAREFISMASREKKLIFFVINKFDHIKDKERCKKLILDQIKEISPETYKKSNEFVHFVSSHGKGGEDGGGDDPDDNENDRDEDTDPDFDRLEDNLRNFVLKKRSISKLLPAKTYLLKLLKDLEIIANWNLEKYKLEDIDLNDQFKALQPEITEITEGCKKLVEKVDKLTESAVNEIYVYTKCRINEALSLDPSEFPPYQGFSDIYNYLHRVKNFIVDQIVSNVVISESQAKISAENAVSTINGLAKDQLGEDFMADKIFRSDLMFSKKKHALGKQVKVSFAISDFFAPSIDGILSYLSWGLVTPRSLTAAAEQDKTLAQKFSLSNYSLTQYWKNPSLIFTSKIPTMFIYSVSGLKMATNILFYGTKFFSLHSLRKLSGSLIVFTSILGVAYLIHDFPRALPLNLSEKYKVKLKEIDFAHTTADRVSKEVTQVFKFPTREIVKTCEVVLDKKNVYRRDLECRLRNNAMSMEFFQGLLSRAASERVAVDAIELEVD